MKPRLLLVAVGAAWLAHSTDLWAQAFLSDPRLTDGQGIKAGDFVLHPGIAGEGGYDSNYFQRSGTGIEDPVIPAWRLRLTPSLSFQNFGRRSGDEYGGPITGGPSVVQLNGRFAASYNALFSGNGDFSDQVKNQDHVAGTATLGADFFPRSTFGADLSGLYTRMVEASNDPDTSNAFSRDVVRAGAGITWRPGGGLFTWRLGYSLTANLFEDSPFQGYNNLQNRVETMGRWRFLPRTAIVYRGNITWLDYYNNPATLNNGNYVNTQIGVNGLITNYFGFLALVGWGGSFYRQNGPVPAQNFDSFTGQAELSWYPTPQRELTGAMGRTPGLSSVSVGYNRNFNISYLGDYYQRDRGYISGVYFVGQRLVFSLIGGFSHIIRPPAYFANGVERAGSAGAENRVDAIAFAEYRPATSLGVYATFRYDAELTEKNVQLVQGQAAPVDDLQFTRYQGYLGIRWFL